ncbi:MAG: SUMF1/EgtB/PvdO family nonheme iron enzyme [Polyangiaceae bacterium]|nr:SUMF1/EgtB/PvdO family nonheme iron enzyme [Polyangiaceae bacterium]
MIPKFSWVDCTRTLRRWPAFVLLLLSAGSNLPACGGATSESIGGNTNWQICITSAECVDQDQVCQCNYCTPLCSGALACNRPPADICVSQGPLSPMGAMTMGAPALGAGGVSSVGRGGLLICKDDRDCPTGGSCARASAGDEFGACAGPAGPAPVSGGGFGGVASEGGGPMVAGPSCLGLASDCGALGVDSCCASGVIPGGTFDRSNDTNFPATVSGFRLDNYEVTVGRFRKFVAAYSQSMIPPGAGKNVNNPADPGWDSAWNASLPANRAALTAAVKCDPTYQTWTDAPGPNENLPINCVDWYEAEAFCTWDGGRLPTEAEWNYAAAGGGEQRVYPWGTMVPGANASLAVYGCNYNGQGTCMGVTNIAPVGSVIAGNGKWGQSDLAGNVSEWNQDWYLLNVYPPMTCNDCTSSEVTSNRVFRGGNFYNLATTLTSASRDGNLPTNHYYVTGLRCARSL